MVALEEGINEGHFFTGDNGKSNIGLSVDFNKCIFPFDFEENTAG
jgi:hypothetical protein